MIITKVYPHLLRHLKISSMMLSTTSDSQNVQLKSQLNEVNQSTVPDDLKVNLLNSIFNRILLESHEFYLIDKPVGLSLFRSKPLANLSYNGISSKVTVEDILPDLCSKLKRKDNLFISSELSWEYSGLFVVSKTKKHADICKDFYKNSSMGKIPGYINQSYRCLCWNRPRYPKSQSMPFSYTFYQPDKSDLQYSISYKCPSPTNRQVKERKFLTKHIGHEVVSVGNTENDNFALVDVKCNSSYRGLVQLYLLHQGCIVLGEFVQASRLLPGGVNNDVCILPPEKANPGKLLPMQLRQKLGHLNRNLKEMPLHIHCNELLVPSTTKSRKDKSYLTDNHFNFNSNPSVCINWDNEIKQNVCTYYSLPTFYIDTMKQLNINCPFDEIQFLN